MQIVHVNVFVFQTAEKNWLHQLIGTAMGIIAAVLIKGWIQQ